MLVNFKNLNFSDIDNFVSKEIVRSSGHMMVQLLGLFIQEEIFSTYNGYLIVCCCGDNIPNPKIHFFEKDKANKFYDFLTSSMSDNSTYCEVDVLEFGAI